MQSRRIDSSRWHPLRLCVCAMLPVIALTTCLTSSDTIHIAVAANFIEPASKIAELFETATGQQPILSFGSTGQFYAQITQDAPFDVFLAADQEAPRRLVEAGLGVPESQFTYAVGKIVLFGPGFDLTQGETVLREGSFDRLAIANPATAPYGTAALEVLESLGLYRLLMGRIVQGNNIAQTFQFVASGNAELGFVAQSQVAGLGTRSIWAVPETLYSPIRQDAVLLSRSAAKRDAQAFIEFLRSREASGVIESFGYGTLQ